MSYYYGVGDIDPVTIGSYMSTIVDALARRELSWLIRVATSDAYRSLRYLGLLMLDDVAIEECVVDQTVLLECFDTDEHGVFTYWVCKAGEHTYRSGNDGYGPYPIDQGDYDDDR